MIDLSMRAAMLALILFAALLQSPTSSPTQQPVSPQATQSVDSFTVLKQRVHFLRAGEAQGRLSEHRFLTTLILMANELGVDVDQIPRLLVIHCDESYGDWLMMKDSNVSMYSPTNDSPSNFYELWVRRDVTDYAMVIISAQLFMKWSGITEDQAVVVAGKTYKKLQDMIDVSRPK